MKCTCGNEIAALATSCPKCGKTYIAKTAAIVVVFLFLLGGFLLFMMSI